MVQDSTTSIELGPRYRVRLFGAFLLEDVERGVSATLGRKARAVAAYLVLAGPDPVPRDRLAALCWGDRGEEQARASLR